MVDDDETDGYLMHRAHQRSGVDLELVVFDNGPDFLSYLHDFDPDDGDLPTVVILDINMPGMDGFEVLATLRSDERFRDVPVVMFYSNSDNPADEQRAEAFGCQLQQKYTTTSDIAGFLRRLVGPPPNGSPS